MGNSTAQPLQCVFSVGVQPSELAYTIIIGTAAFLGTVYACFGYRLFRYIMFITGFVTGGAAAYALCVIFGRNLIPIEAVIAIVLTSSVVFGCFSLLVEYISLFLNGLYCGLLIGACTYTVFHITPGFVQPLTCVSFAITLGAVSMCRCAVCGLTILATSMNGAFAIALAIDHFLADALLRRTLLIRLESYYVALSGTTQQPATWAVSNGTNATGNWTEAGYNSSAMLNLNASTLQGGVLNLASTFWTAPFGVQFDTSCHVLLVLLGVFVLLGVLACFLQHYVTRRMLGGDEQVHETRLIYVTCSSKRGANGECDSSSESASIVNVPIASVVDSKRQPLLLTVQPPTPEMVRQSSMDRRAAGKRNRMSDSPPNTKASKSTSSAHTSQNTLVRAQKFRRLYRARRTGGDVISSECAASIREAVQQKSSVTEAPVSSQTAAAMNNGNNAQPTTGSLPTGAQSRPTALSHAAQSNRHCPTSQSRDSLSNFSDHQAPSASRAVRSSHESSLPNAKKSSRSSAMDANELPYTVFVNPKVQAHSQSLGDGQNHNQNQLSPLGDGHSPVPSEQNVQRVTDSEPPVVMRNTRRAQDPEINSSQLENVAEKRQSQSIEVQTDDPNWLTQLASFDTRSNNPDAAVSLHSGTSGSQQSVTINTSQPGTCNSSQVDLVSSGQRTSNASPIWQKRDGAKYAHRNRQQHPSALQPLLEHAQSQNARDPSEWQPSLSFEPERRVEAEPDLISDGPVRQMTDLDENAALIEPVLISTPAFELNGPSRSKANSHDADKSSRPHALLGSPGECDNVQQDPEPERRREHSHEHGHHKHKHKHHSHGHHRHSHRHHSNDQSSSAAMEAVAEPRSDSGTIQQAQLGDDVTVPVVRTIEDYRREQRHRRRQEREQQRGDTSGSGDRDSIL